jgi:hypothetical protein
MRSKQAQGISINTVVIVIIALLVLALILAFATGSFSRLSGKLKDSEGATGQTEIVAMEAQCSQSCLRAKSIGIATQWTETDYCTRNFTIDDEETHCWQAPISKWCEVTTRNGAGDEVTCDPGAADAEICSQCS